MKYGLNPKFFGAVVAHETGWGTSNALNKYNNPGGMMDGKTANNTDFRNYPNIGAGLEAMAQNLRKNYIDNGLTTVSQIGAKYSPVGAANDPRGLNNDWVTGVSRIMKGL